MSSKGPIIINILLSCVFIAGLSGSSYALGQEKGNRASDAYHVAAAFTAVSATLTVVSLVILIVLVSSYASSPDFSGFPTSPGY
jgi:cytochrome bd-type quinol oxidase subunit 2